ncbi:MAG TPA: helix-turn-helix domain-containing protein [Leptospiraceae bacterium]|nr:helix-turn-helix domain-containing protein [Leptospiraceae bacterium]HNB96767.1 helix-turn-helix domain-containing protein [Leptospiraceae bacterium]HNC53954.1 helix-turn-helix domain-containing protein [Leptospiraceae bacterium]HNE06684.1 helix-turn-helix domain-containing protein [Leptospiraceae bacterium]HNG98064.1 helix-turn-helix domain-containing protein [Leptospiraceae bacterium]
MGEKESNMISGLIKKSMQDPKSFYENVEAFFEGFAQILECNCGILVLQDKEDSFLEVSSFGYLDDWYYSFLARGLGNLEKIISTDNFVYFPSENFKLYNPKSKHGFGYRIECQGKVFGFIFLESVQELSDLKKEFVKIICNDIGFIHLSKTNFTEKKPLDRDEISHDLFAFLLRDSLGFTNTLKANRFINIQGGRGVGKKSLVKFIYNKLGLHGKLIYLNALPDSVEKLEKSIRDWILLAENGILIIENVSSLSISQQRVFFEIIKEPILEPRIIFLDDMMKHREEYQPFWNLLSQHTIRLPELLSLDKEVFREIVNILFYDLRQLHSRPDMMLMDEVYEFLFQYPYNENLRELRNLLEMPLINLKENIITKEFYLKLNNSEIKSLDFYNKEDLDLRKSVQALERQKILLANKLFSGNQIKMAKALGVSRGSLQYKMKQLELH